MIDTKNFLRACECLSKERVNFFRKIFTKGFYVNIEDMPPLCKKVYEDTKKLHDNIVLKDDKIKMVSI